ncbi:MAG: DUF2605 domain-containing protein [Pseudanabaenaceae cyanobacterium SKYGB_i_bin29]|nr:DUF2605 domain-containing protein [Pseudanabaenaceae cyanobacterium SKYG29]MDW8420633.1 DUF2605 domain-containing protein [Pseudanabaenaceae cyanobacterium SKYGB_i_bin29]
MSAADLLPQVLEPLLEDFRYWFDRSQQFLTTHRLPFLEKEQQADLLRRVEETQKSIAAATTMFHLSDKKVAIDTALVMEWHKLLMECQAVAMRYRQQ